LNILGTKYNYLFFNEKLYKTSKDDVDTFMNILKDDIKNGTPKQQEEYASYLSQYKTLKAKYATNKTKPPPSSSTALGAINL
jgi:hypothetical protein